MALSQDNLNFPLCLHSNTSSFLSFNSSLRFLKSIILFFSSIPKLDLPLKLLTVEECPIIFYLIWQGQCLRFLKYFDWAVWFLSHRLEKACLWLSLFPISSGDVNIDYLSIIIMFHRRNATSAQRPFILTSTVTRLPSFTTSSFSSLLFWLFKMLCIFLVQE